MVLSGGRKLVLSGGLKLVLSGVLKLVLCVGLKLVLSGSLKLVLSGDRKLVLSGVLKLVLSRGLKLVLSAGPSGLRSESPSDFKVSFTPLPASLWCRLTTRVYKTNPAQNRTQQTKIRIRPYLHIIIASHATQPSQQNTHPKKQNVSMLSMQAFFFSHGAHLAVLQGTLAFGSAFLASRKMRFRTESAETYHQNTS